MRSKTSIHRMRGLGVIAALVVLILLSALAAAIVSLTGTQQTTITQDVLSARAWQAARAGNEYGLHQALKSGTWGGAGTCNSTNARTTTLDLSASTGFQVTVTCTAWSYNEGETVPGTANITTVYRIYATACPTAPCPQTGAAVAGNGYIERTRVVIATN